MESEGVRARWPVGLAGWAREGVLAWRGVGSEGRDGPSSLRPGLAGLLGEQGDLGEPLLGGHGLEAGGEVLERFLAALLLPLSQEYLCDQCYDLY